MSETPELEYVRVTLVVDYPLPADLAERMTLYGTVDAAACVKIDIENDPAVFLLESGIEITSISPVAAETAETVLRAAMTDPTGCSCKGTGWTFNDKSYDGYENGPPYEEPTRDNGGYSPCGFCNPGGWNVDGPMVPELSMG